MDTETEGHDVFQCPYCYQRYSLPPVTTGQIRAHMRQRHGKAHDTRWVKARVKEKKRSTV